MNKLYKKEVCVNCANDKCSNKIETKKYLELVIDNMSTTTVIKCEDFICKNKRKKMPASWQNW